MISSWSRRRGDPRDHALYVMYNPARRGSRRSRPELCTHVVQITTRLRSRRGSPDADQMPGFTGEHDLARPGIRPTRRQLDRSRVNGSRDVADRSRSRLGHPCPTAPKPARKPKPTTDRRQNSCLCFAATGQAKDTRRCTTTLYNKPGFRRVCRPGGGGAARRTGRRRRGAGDRDRGCPHESARERLGPPRPRAPEHRRPLHAARVEDRERVIDDVLERVRATRRLT
jgi:hypothetical protein